MFSFIFKNFITKTLVSALMAIFWAVSVVMLIAAGTFEILFPESLRLQKALALVTHWENLTLSVFYFSAGTALAGAVFASVAGVVLSFFGIVLNMWLRTGITLLFTAAGFFVWFRILGADF